MNLLGQFDTPRLRVWEFDVIPPSADLMRTTYVGWLREEDQTYPVIVVTDGPLGLEMVWTHDFYRRKGLARELLDSLRDGGVDIHGDGVSYEGACLVVALGLGCDARTTEETAAKPLPAD